MKENCTRLGEIVKKFGEHLPGLEKQTPSLSYPNLITHSLNRGGLTTVDSLTFKFFCGLERCIRPHLNITNFRCSTRKSDSEMLEQLIENTPTLFETWPFSSHLSDEDSMLPLRLCTDLYYRVRK